jgi:GT2 family glycosyltransferase
VILEIAADEKNRVMATQPSVTAVIVTWNSARHIRECIESIQKQIFGGVAIVVVDSQSSDGTPELVEEMSPPVEVVRCDTNVGYREGNRLGMSGRSSDYIVVLNDDLSLAGNTIDLLVKYMEKHPRVALVTPMVLMQSSPDVMNTAGNRLSYCGLPSCRGKGMSPRQFNESGPVAAVAGCAFAIRRSVLEKIGGFSVDFGRYACGWHSSLEDADLSLRAWIAGYEVHYVADAVVFHKYTQRGMNVQRYAAMESGRHLLLLRNLERGTLVRLIPVIVAMELVTLLYAALRGPRWLVARLDILRWIVTHREEIRAMRRRIQRLRVVRDREVISHLDDQIEFAGALGGGYAARTLQGALTMALHAYRHMFLYGGHAHPIEKNA